ncbi:MAG: HD-GYP domain-containing protein [Bradymonadaceae bacterium]
MTNRWRQLPLSVRVGLLYLIFGVTWILVSDTAVEVLASTQAGQARLQTYKGSAFIVLSAAYIGVVVAQQLRRESRVRQLLDRLVNLSPDPIVVRDAESDQIVQANRRFASELDRSREDVIGAELDELDLSLRELEDDDLCRQLQDNGEVEGYRQTLEGEETSELIVSSSRLEVDDEAFVCTVAKDVTKLTEAYDETIRGWARALELRDDETFAHTLRVTQATVALARELGVLEDELVDIRRGALLHDVGKIGVPDRILLKDGDLTDDEWAVVHKHPVFAYQLLSPIDYLEPAIDIPHRHHEKWDGSGYPDGLSGEDIPLAARIFAVVDVWDALRSDRPYRDAWPEERVLEHLADDKGSHFQPEIVDAFLEIDDDRRRQLRDVDADPVPG